MILSQGQIKQIIQEIQDQAEVNRRALAKRRHDIYKDGGKAFLIEKILREFGEDALSEMRLIPINLLKKIVKKMAGVYKRPPIRKATDPNDQALIDYYSEELCINELMQKANRYLVLASNTVVYVVPKEGELKACVVPSYQYSLVPNEMNKTHIENFVFSSFVDEGRVSPQSSQFSATGVESFSEERSDKVSPDYVASNEKETLQQANRLIFWGNEAHFTTNESGDIFMDPNQDQSQFINPIGMCPVVNIARDRDNEAWATQGEDMIDVAMALQMGWTDVMTIAKHQGFSILTITSEEEPKKLSIGVNRAVWLKTNLAGGPQPSIGYVQGNSPLEQYKGLLIELLGLLLTTNDLNPNALGSSSNQQNFTSGFHALIAMADSLEAIEADKPLMLNAEKKLWEIIPAWHNWMFDSGNLNDEAKSLGKFTDSFEISVIFADIKPLESEDDVINRVKLLMDQGLITRKDALKKLNPDLTDDQIVQKMLEIDQEKQMNVAMAQNMFSSPVSTNNSGDQANASQDGLQQGNLQQESKNGAQVGQAAEAGSGNSVLN